MKKLSLQKMIKEQRNVIIVTRWLARMLFLKAYKKENARKTFFQHLVNCRQDTAYIIYGKPTV